MSLAQRGAVVHGVDYLDKNIALCQALAQEHPSLQISFSEGRIEDIVPTLHPSQYDLVLGLSVFHHLVHAHGAQSVKALLKQLAEVSGVLVLEMALQNEPLYWGPSQPADPRDLIHEIGFVHLVTHHETHLAQIPRPLFIASNHYWILADVAGEFDHWSFESHANAHGIHGFGRRYLFSNDVVLKMYRHDNESWIYNNEDFRREINFLLSPARDFLAPHLVTHGEHHTESWLVMERLPGRLLLDLIREKTAYDSHRILLAVLRQLAALEVAGLYHNDVRTWNVLVDEPSGAVHLIDYGSISATAKDCVWPGNLYFSFLIFVNEIATGRVDTPIPLRTISISPFSLPDPYRAWAVSFWEKPMSEWSFESMYQSLTESHRSSNSTNLGEQPMTLWMHAIEEAIQTHKQHTSHLAPLTKVDALHSEVKVLHAEIKALRSEAKQAEAIAQHAETKAQEAVVASTQHLAHLQAVYTSRSWRITSPLRWMVTQAKLLRSSGINSRVKALAKKVLRKANHELQRRPALRQRILGWSHKLGFYGWLRALHAKSQVDPNSFYTRGGALLPAQTHRQDLSPRALQIYTDLKAAIQQQRKGRD